MIVRLIKNNVKSLNDTTECIECGWFFSPGPAAEMRGPGTESGRSAMDNTLRNNRNKPGDPYFRSVKFAQDTFYYCIRQVFPVFFCSLGAKFC